MNDLNARSFLLACFVVGVLLTLSVALAQLSFIPGENTEKEPAELVELTNNSENNLKTTKSDDAGKDRLFVEMTDETGLGEVGATDNPYSRSEKSEGDFGVGMYASDINTDKKNEILVITGYEPSVYKYTGNKFIETDVLPRIQSQVVAAIFFDYDNDGWPDLYLLSNERSVFLENREGDFVKHKVGLEVEYEAVRAASVADYTGNGCLDVFVVQANHWDEARPTGYDEFEVGLDEDNGNPNRLFAGNCETFNETTEEAGIRGKGWSLATSFVDFNNDGYPDIHVANDFNNDVLYINEGDETFDRRVMADYTNRNGMSSEVSDVNGDGYLDIFVSNIYVPVGGELGNESFSNRYEGRTEGNNLLLNKGNGSFEDVAGDYGVRKSYWGWATLVEDFDNDRELEIYQTDWSNNDGTFWQSKGKKEFIKTDSGEVGIGSESSVAAVATDVDTDGGLDILESVVLDSSETVSFNKNVDTSGNWTQVYISRGGLNHTLLGTRVHVTADGREQMRVLTSNSDYFSQSSKVLHFGLGNSDNVDRLRVEWPGGEINTYENIESNHRLVLGPKKGLRVNE